MFLVCVLAISVTARAETHHTLRFYNSRAKPQAGESLAFSPDSRELALVTEGGTTRIRVADAEQLAKVKMNGQTIGYSADGRRILVLSQVISEWDCTSGKFEPLQIPDPPPGALGVKLNQKNGKTIVEEVLPGSPAERSGKIAARDELVAIDRDKNNQPNSILGLPREQVMKRLAGAMATPVELFLVPEGSTESSSVRLIRALTRKNGETTEYFAAALQAPEPSLLCLVRAGRCELVRTSNSRIVTILPTQHLPRVRAAVLSPDGQHAALLGELSGGRIGVECVDAINNQTVAFYDLPDKRLDDVRFTRDGQCLLTLSATRIAKLDLDQEASPVFFNHEGTLSPLTPPGVYAVAGHLLDQVFDLNTFGGGFRWRILQSDPLHPQSLSTLRERIRTLRRVAASAIGLLAIGTAEGEVRLLDLETGNPVREFGKPRDGAVELLDFSPDGHWLAYYVSGTLHLVDVSSLRDTAIAAGELDRMDATADGSGFTLSSVTGAFQATFPAKPKYDANQHEYVAQLEGGRVKYAVVFMDHGAKLAELTPDPVALRDLYDTVCASFAKHTQGRTDQSIDHDTEPVVERSVRWTFERNGQEYRTNARLTARETRLYLVSVTQATPESVSQEEIDRFLATFKPQTSTRPQAER